MKILYHHRTASNDGQAVHIEEMVSALRELGHQVLVVSPGGSDDSGEMGDGVVWIKKIRLMLPKSVYELLELAYSFVAYHRLSAAADVFKPDVIYERYNLFLLAGVLLKRRLGVPLLMEVNAPLAYERGKFGGLGLPRLAKWAEGVAWRGADVVLPVTKVLAQHVMQAKVPSSRILVIPNGINEAHFANALSPETAREKLNLGKGLVLGFTGFVRDWHGVDRVVRWLASDACPINAQLLVVGDGPARQNLETLAKECKVGDRVRFTGFVPRSQVPSFVAAFDVALQPAVVPYASPLKLFEYLALNKAILAPRMPNIEEVLADNVNAVLFDDGKEGSFESALNALCSNPATREQLGKAAGETIQSMGLTWKRNAERVVAVAVVALNKSSGP